jgi:hypothetical protein
MTDDKGAGEGPYLWGYDSYDDMCIFGPSLDENGWNPYKLKKIYRVCEKLNSAYATGRKAERERCLAIANRHPDKCDGITLRDCMETIKDEIRGGQDGK